jgi:hypothetical protein
MSEEIRGIHDKVAGKELTVHLGRRQTIPQGSTPTDIGCLTTEYLIGIVNNVILMAKDMNIEEKIITHILTRLK